MTDMKRITVSLTDEIDDEIKTIRDNDRTRMSYSAAIRMLVVRGLEAYRAAQTQTQEQV